MKKQFIFVTVFIALFTSSTYAASNLGWNFLYKSASPLFELKLKKPPAGNQFYLIDYLFRVGSDKKQCRVEGTTQGAYWSRYSSQYIIDDNTKCDVAGNITSASAQVSVSSCPDSTFKNCTEVASEVLMVVFHDDKITEIIPNFMEVSI